MTEVNRPIDVLEAQVELIHWWRDHQSAPRAAQGFDDLMFGLTGIKKKGILRPFLVERLDKSETLFVRSHIAARLWEMADRLEPEESEVLQPEDLGPVPNGFAWFESCRYLPDAYGDIQAIQAISWSTENGGVAVIEWANASDPLDFMNDTWKDQNPRTRLLAIHPIHIMGWNWGRQVRYLNPDQISPDPLVRDIEGENTKRTAERLAWRREHHAENVATVSRWNRFILMLWEWLQEQAPVRFPAHRALRRRLERTANIATEVLVVDLRPFPNHQDHNPNPTEIAWTHRWRVREHKRRWIDKKGNYRETTVRAHIKGPEDKPLVIKDRVFDVKR